jgi:hypothetical protein
MTKKALELQERRSELVHDNLKNTLIQLLRAMESELMSVEPSRAYLLDRLASVPELWRLCYEQSAYFVNAYEDLMSPRILLEDKPFAKQQQKPSVWLEDVVHLSWLNRYDIRAKIDGIREMLQTAHSAYASMFEVLPDKPTLQDVLEIREQVVEFADSCERLRKQLRTLPNEIRVV